MRRTDPTQQAKTEASKPLVTLIRQAWRERQVRIDHFSGVSVSGDTVMGDDVVIRHGVTIGLRRTGVRGAPVLGNRVDIGAGAKILGTITVGDDVTIGTNAVVLNDVPANSIAVGVRAKILPRKPTAVPLMQADLAAE